MCQPLQILLPIFVIPGKMAFCSFPRTTTWYTAPGASNLGGLAINLNNTSFQD